MAAADYFQGPTRPAQQQPFLNPPQAPQRASSHPNVNFSQQSFQQSAQAPYNQGRPPPPYAPLPEEQNPSVHFAPTPSPVAQGRHSFSHQQRPPPQNWVGQPAPQPYQSALKFTPPNGVYQTQQPQQQLQPYPPQQHQPYNAQQRPSRPFHHPVNYSTTSLSTGGYNSDPEPHRRHRHHRHHNSSPSGQERSHPRHRRVSESSRSANTDGLLGAAGGGLIGDLIFPGLGTVGGALAGWLGGKDYGQKRKHREEKRDMKQWEWEERYGHSRPRSGERERDHYERDDFERRRSHDRGDRDRKSDY